MHLTQRDLQPISPKLSFAFSPTRTHPRPSAKPPRSTPLQHTFPRDFCPPWDSDEHRSPERRAHFKSRLALASYPPTRSFEKDDIAKTYDIFTGLTEDGRDLWMEDQAERIRKGKEMIENGGFNWVSAMNLFAEPTGETPPAKIYPADWGSSGHYGGFRSSLHEGGQGQAFGRG